jgi:hypothetical protein
VRDILPGRVSESAHSSTVRSDTTIADAGTSSPRDEQRDIDALFREFESQRAVLQDLGKRKPKDIWDKLGVVATFTSSVLIAALAQTGRTGA